MQESTSHPRLTITQQAQGQLAGRARAVRGLAIRRLRRLRQRDLGTAPAVIYVAGCYGVFSLEELLRLPGTPPRESLLPTLAKSSFSDAPT